MIRKIADPEPPTGLRRILFRAPIWLYRMHLGSLLGRRFLLLTHTGRKTGRRRRVVLEIVDHDPECRIYHLASGYGQRAQWYRNIPQHPAVTIRVGGRSTAATAAPLPPTESGRAMVEYAQRHPRLARRLMRFCGYEVDGSDQDYFAIGRDHVPIVEVTVA